MTECSNADCSTVLPHLASLEKGKLKISQSVIQVNAVNSRGVAAGSVDVGFNEEFGVTETQAASLRKDRVSLIPPQQPNEILGTALALNDRRSFLLESISAENRVLSLLINDHLTPLNFDSDLVPVRFKINNLNFVYGDAQKYLPNGFVVYRAFLYNPQTAATTVLNPLPTEPHSYAMDLNFKGDILGYSFFFSGLERIGVWDKTGQFKTYFVEGTPEFPTISNRLLFIDEGVILITAVSSPESERGMSYVVPKPGKRLNLADLVVNLPVGHNKKIAIRDMNNKGDLLGNDAQGYVVLKRIDD